MSQEPFDPNAITVEGIFRAKLARRRLLAKLPFEQKIEIVKKLQQVSTLAMRNEKLVFASFLEAYPELASEIVEWDVVDEWYVKRALDPPPHPFDKRPDIIAVTRSGKKIGVELKSWVNREQIAAARKQERIQENIRKAIGDLPPNTTEHIGYVWLDAKQVRFDPSEARDFREQIFRLIEEVDESWPQKPPSQNSFKHLSDFPGFGLLEKYLKSARFHPVGRRGIRTRWISFPRSPHPSGHYSPNDMRETLKRALLSHRSDNKYKDLREHVGLDEVYLLVHYDFKAFAYNTPFDASGFGFKEAAALASTELSGDRGYFDRIFLFHFLTGREKAERIL